MTPGSSTLIFLTGTGQRAGLVPIKKIEVKLPGVMVKQLRQIQVLLTIPTLRYVLYLGIVNCNYLLT